MERIDFRSGAGPVREWYERSAPKSEIHSKLLAEEFSLVCGSRSRWGWKPELKGTIRSTPGGSRIEYEIDRDLTACQLAAWVFLLVKVLLFLSEWRGGLPLLLILFTWVGVMFLVITFEIPEQEERLKRFLRSHPDIVPAGAPTVPVS